MVPAWIYRLCYSWCSPGAHPPSQQTRSGSSTRRCCDCRTSRRTRTGRLSPERPTTHCRSSSRPSSTLRGPAGPDRRRHVGGSRVRQLHSRGLRPGRIQHLRGSRRGRTPRTVPRNRYPGRLIPHGTGGLISRLVGEDVRVTALAPYELDVSTAADRTEAGAIQLAAESESLVVPHGFWTSWQSNTARRCCSGAFMHQGDLTLGDEEQILAPAVERLKAL
jgi:hypothetical protein